LNDEIIHAKFNALEEGHGELITFLLAKVETLEKRLNILQQKLDGEQFGDGNIQI
jgi:hypothetical protein